MRAIHLSLCAAALAAPAPALAEADIAKGEKVFRKCMACHETGPEAKTKTGPVLTGIVGAPAARDPDFSYSAALEEAAADGLVWDRDALAAFLAKPREFLKGTKMSFAGLRKESEIENLIAFLAAQTGG